MKFLETITALDNDVLVPVKDIELIWISMGPHGQQINIKGKGEYLWIECFGKNKEKLIARYAMIKKILGVPDEDDFLKKKSD